MSGSGSFFRPAYADLRRKGGLHQPFAGVSRHGAAVNKTVRPQVLRREKEKQMIQVLAARVQFAKMRAEEGQALIEYALIVSLISVIAIVALQVTGHSV